MQQSVRSTATKQLRTIDDLPYREFRGTFQQGCFQTVLCLLRRCCSPDRNLLSACWDRTRKKEDLITFEKTTAEESDNRYHSDSACELCKNAGIRALAETV